MTSLYVPETQLRRTQPRFSVALLVVVGVIAILALIAGVRDTNIMNATAGLAMDELLRDEQIAARLGEPLVAGQPSGQVTVERDYLDVEIAMPVEGLRSRAMLYATAIVADGETTLTSVTVATGADRVEIRIGPEAQP